MGSSFVDKSLKASAYNARTADSTSPARTYSVNSAFKKGSNSAASGSSSKQDPQARTSALFDSNTAGPTKTNPLQTVSPKRRFSGSFVSPPRSSSFSFSSYHPADAVASPGTTGAYARVGSTHRTTSYNSGGERASAVSPGRARVLRAGRRKSAGEASLGNLSATAAASSAEARFQGSPYLGKGSYERTPSAARKSSFGASLQNLSKTLAAAATPPHAAALSPSPLVTTLGSPVVDFSDAALGVSNSPLLHSNDGGGDDDDDADDDDVSRLSSSPLEAYPDPGGSPTDVFHRTEQEEVAAENPGRQDPTSPPPTAAVGEAVRSSFPSSFPAGVALMTNPLYPVISGISSPISSPSPPPSAPHIDGFNIPAVGINLPNAASDASPVSKVEEISPTTESPAEFLQRRRAAAAFQRQKGGGADRTSAASQAIIKRRSQVLSTVQKARTRLSLLTYEVAKKRRSFGRGWIGRFRRWIYERERKRLMGKGTVWLRLWVHSLKSMEVSYGSTMMLAFSFIRWVFLLNAVLAVLWFALIILPFMINPPRTFTWKVFWHQLGDKKEVKETLQGSNLEKTFVYYGGYTYTRAEQPNSYRTDYMYAVCIGATFLISFLGVLARIAGMIMNSGDIALAARLYPFSSLVFASWDFHITSIEAATKLRRGIRMQLKELLADATVKEKISVHRDRLISAKRFSVLFILWPCAMAGTVTAVVFLVTKAEEVNQKLGSKYAQAALLSILNIFMPVIARVLVEWEDFKPATAERVVLLKLFCLRLLNLGTLFYRLFMMLIHTLQLRENEVAVESCLAENRCEEGFTCCTHANMTQWNICTDRDINLCLPACMENVVGTQLLRLIFVTTLINNAYELIYGFGYVWATSGNRRQLYIEDMAIDIVYVQALVWVGSCFSPMASILGFFSNLITWYCMRFALFRTCAPVEKVHSASRTSTLTYGLLLLTLILATIPATINVMQRSSGFCGPIHERISMYDVVRRYIQKAPSGLWVTISWLTNPAVLLGVILLLIFGVVLLQSKLIQSRHFLTLTKHEMGMQRREATEKLLRVRQTINQGAPINRTSAAALPELSTSPPKGSRASQEGSTSTYISGQLEAVKISTETSTNRDGIEASKRRESIGTHTERDRIEATRREHLIFSEKERERESIETARRESIGSMRIEPTRKDSIEYTKRK